MGDELGTESLATQLGTRWLGRWHQHVASCSSTNDLAAEAARAGCPEGAIVTADAQTGGRGRLGRSWHSPPGENLYLSIILRPRRPAPEIPPLTLLAGGAFAAGLRTLGFDVQVKWPNDLLLTVGGAPRKLGGILTEAGSEGARITHVVVGLGLNVNTPPDAFPDDLRARATSLLAASGRAHARATVLARLLEAMEPAYQRFVSDGPPAAVELWTTHADLGRRWRVVVNGRPLDGVAAGVAPDGSLLLRDDVGVVHAIAAGEINPI